jgi:hypothetical protein
MRRVQCWWAFIPMLVAACGEELDREDRDAIEVAMLGTPECDRDEIEVALLERRQVLRNADAIDALLVSGTNEAQYFERTERELDELLVPGPARAIGADLELTPDAERALPGGAFQGDRTSFRTALMDFGGGTDGYRREVERQWFWKIIWGVLILFPIAGLVLGVPMLAVRAIRRKRAPRAVWSRGEPAPDTTT